MAEKNVAEKAAETEWKLAGLISALVGQLAPAVELAPAEGESALHLGTRLAAVAEEEIRKLHGHLVATNRQLAAQKGQVTKARNELAAVTAELPDRPRDIAKPAKPMPAAGLIEVLADADDVQLLFSGGKRELAGVAPVRIPDGAWRKDGERVHLTLPDLIVSSQHGRPQDLAGYALLVDGDIVAVSERPEATKIVPNQRYQLAGDVIF